MSDEALASVAAAARRLGIAVDAPRALHDGYNLVVHLAPAPVVAKVMTLFPGDDAAYWRGVAAREVAVAAHLRGHDVPVVPPAEGIDPGPHPCGATCFTLWALADDPGGFLPSPAEFAALLRAVGAGMAAYAGDLPALEAWRHTPPPPVSAPEWLRSAWSRLDARLAAVPPGDLVPAHGDAHPGNLLRLGGRWVWADFEDASRMPRHWDLACGTSAAEAGWAAAVACAAKGDPALALALAARTVQSVCAGLSLAAHGHPAGHSATRRLEAARATLSRLGAL